MVEIIFIVEENSEFGYTAHALNYSIFTEADSIAELKFNIDDAIKCHFDTNELPKIVHMHFVRDEIFAIA